MPFTSLMICAHACKFLSLEGEKYDGRSAARILKGPPRADASVRTPNCSYTVTNERTK